MRTTTRFLSVLALLSLLVFAFAGCGSSGGGGTSTLTVTITVSPAGAGTVTGDGTYEEGDTATLEATANEGYIFSQWGGDVNSASNPLDVLVDGDLSVTAVFRVRICTVTAGVSPAESGDITFDGAGDGTYAYGDTATVTATPRTGYAFSQWTGDSISTDSQITFTIDGDYNLTAVFTPNAYTLNLAINIPGAGAVSGSGARVYGSVVRITAEAYPGYVFSQFDFSAGAVPSSTDNPYDHTMAEDITVTASFRAQTTAWTWMSGPDTPQRSAVWGTEEVPNPANLPGARNFAAGWSDASGNIWISGGYGYTNTTSTTYYRDMWKYDASSGWWSWMAGPQASGNTGINGSVGKFDEAYYPSHRKYGTPITSSDGLWLFGGSGYDNGGAYGELNDLWLFDTGLGQWARMGGDSLNNQSGTYGTRGVADAANQPGSRLQAAGWSDTSGDLWLFGGYGWDDSGYGGKMMNDLWKYHRTSPLTGEWTWMAGASTGNQSAVFGTAGVPNPANHPGARRATAGVADSAGNIWVFGGFAITVGGSTGNMNDLWKFDAGTSRWSWISGSQSVDPSGVYGTLGIPDAGNAPGGRNGHKMWLDVNGDLWVFGGNGRDIEGSEGDLYDLWRFTPSTGKWAWMGGSSYIYGYESPVFGTRGVFDPSSSPGTRYFQYPFAPAALVPSPATGSVWLFGGWTNTGSWWNDLWRFGPDLQ